MGFKAVTVVWDHYPNGGSEKLVLMALANFANDDGFGLFLSVDYIARRCCLTGRQAQRIMGRFIDEGLVEVVGNIGGGAAGTTREYRLRIDLIEVMPSLPMVTRNRGKKRVSEGCKEDETGDIQGTKTEPDTGDIQGDGRHSGSRRATSRVETGDTHVALVKEESKRETKKATRKRVAVPDRPADVPESVWRDFLILRKEKRAPVTETVLGTFREEAGKADLTLAKAMAVSCSMGWQGFRADWYRESRRPTSQPQESRRRLEV